MLTIEDIRRKKKEYGMTNAQLAKLSNVPLGTVQKVLGNVTRSPRMETVQALSGVFEKTEKPKVYYTREPASEYLREPEPAYQAIPVPTSFNTHVYDRQGTYTIDDYLALPDEQRVELIDGVIYDMGAPTSIHQLIGGELYRLISNYIRAGHGSCVPFSAPVDVQLDCDNRTMVQPDVAVVCDRSKVTLKRIFGAPDFVAEVLSPSTRGKDMMIKSGKYYNAGVREYWMIDPREEWVIVYDFRDRDKPGQTFYTFEDTIPVLIYEGDLVIDMKEIREYVSFISRTE